MNKYQEHYEWVSTGNTFIMAQIVKYGLWACYKLLCYAFVSFWYNFLTVVAVAVVVLVFVYEQNKEINAFLK